MIDLVAHDRTSAVAVAIEVQSQVRRLEQQLRWSNEKADALPSAEFWRFADPEPRVERLLVLRSTRANRDVAARFSATLSAMYPARSIDAFAALTTAETAWPGSAVLWANVDGDTARILERPPRMIPVGR